MKAWELEGILQTSVNPVQTQLLQHSNYKQVSPSGQKIKISSRRQIDDGSCLTEDPYSLQLLKDKKLSSNSIWGHPKLLLLLPRYAIQLDSLVKDILFGSTTCAQVNPRGKNSPRGSMPRSSPGGHWEIDFTKMKSKVLGYQYLLVFTDTFSGRMKECTTWLEKTIVVTKKLLQTFITRFRLPLFLGPNNELAFMAKIHFPKFDKDSKY